jgi:hypothetical protein
MGLTNYGQFSELAAANASGTNIKTQEDIEHDAGVLVDPFEALKTIDISMNNDTGPNASFVGNNADANMKTLSQIYGNNVFDLFVDNNHLIGVLQEMPSFSRTAQWIPTVSTNITEKIKGALNDEKYQLISSLVGTPQVPVVLAGSNTTQRYQTSNPVTFNLKFRIYSQQAIGPAAYLTGYKRALAMLTIYTPPIHSYDNKNTLQLLVGNVASTINEGLKTLANITDYANMQLFEGADATNTQVNENLKSAKVEGMKLVNMMYDVYMADSKSRTEKTKMFTAELAHAADMFNKMLEGDVIAQLHNDQTRVNSSLNTYNGIFGGAIWNLTIMPGILKYSIPVCITNWTASLSKEIDNNGDAAYCDFTIACQTDQDKSALYWLNQIYSSDTDAYKLAFAKRNNKD